MLPQNLFKFSKILKEWNASFKSNTDRTSHLELPNTENLFFNNGQAKLFFAILTFKCLKSFLLINITGLEYAEKASFNIPQ